MFTLYYFQYNVLLKVSHAYTITYTFAVRASKLDFKLAILGQPLLLAALSHSTI